ncbi:hypothetical protein EZH22_16800 [Xanthobacter dioxanivorans]|uniref:Uncharacterized protein n=1 Tax=Xanthobacter dioxanivorans TaxID=2528964 RepID=A0A974SG11_9HYPH|nr:hypothetical protein [Xanthobacter dioxanivorans]QRG04811.1 hypothetical protein EZH22_16800 [Xanthobacter dioxanivorans]
MEKDKSDRRAAALRANLARRKEQARGRKAAAEPGEPRGRKAAAEPGEPRGGGAEEAASPGSAKLTPREPPIVPDDEPG